PAIIIATETGNDETTVAKGIDAVGKVERCASQCRAGREQVPKRFAERKNRFLHDPYLSDTFAIGVQLSNPPAADWIWRSHPTVAAVRRKCRKQKCPDCLGPGHFQRSSFTAVSRHHRRELHRAPV